MADLINEIISTTKLAIAGASEFEVGDDKQIFYELYLRPVEIMLARMYPHIFEINHKESKELTCIMKAFTLEMERIKNL